MVSYFHSMLIFVIITLIKAEESTNDIIQDINRKPLGGPKIFSLIAILSATSALLTWQDVSSDFVPDHSYYYKIETWVKNDEENIKETLIKANFTMVLVTTLTPYSTNYARIMVVTDKFNGPPSNIIQFETPEGVPSPVQTVMVFPLGSSNFMVQWKRPIFTNGRLQGYKIYYEEICGNFLKQNLESQLIVNANTTQAKLKGLRSNTSYRIHILGFTKQGNGEDYYIEKRTSLPGSSIPTPPTFSIECTHSDSGYVTAKVTWHPDFSGTPGSHFYVQYRKVDETSSTFFKNDFELYEDFIRIVALDPNEQYEFVVVSVDGNYETLSQPQRFKTNVG